NGTWSRVIQGCQASNQQKSTYPPYGTNRQPNNILSSGSSSAAMTRYCWVACWYRTEGTCSFVGCWPGNPGLPGSRFHYSVWPPRRLLTPSASDSHASF